MPLPFSAADSPFERKPKPILICPRFSVFVLQNLKEKIQFSEMIKLFEATGVKMSHVAYWKNVRKLHKEGRIRLERHEELWLIPIPPSESELTTNTNNSMLGRKIDKRIHSTHKIKLSMPYSGEQPKEGGIEKAFGRYLTARQYIFHRGTSTIGSYKNKIVIWVRNPGGILTSEQRINAKADGYRVLREFAQEHKIALEGYLEKVDLSHHVVENDALNDALKPMVSNYKQIKKRLGTAVCQTSHPGRIEHEGKARVDRIVRGDKVAEGLENLVLDFPDDLKKIQHAIALQTEAINKQTAADISLASNIQLHLQVLQDIRDAIKEQKKGEKVG
jgi:hypothetical protein